MNTKNMQKKGPSHSKFIYQKFLFFNHPPRRWFIIKLRVILNLLILASDGEEIQNKTIQKSLKRSQKVDKALCYRLRARTWQKGIASALDKTTTSNTWCVKMSANGTIPSVLALTQISLSNRAIILSSFVHIAPGLQKPRCQISKIAVNGAELKVDLTEISMYIYLKKVHQSPKLQKIEKHMFRCV